MQQNAIRREIKPMVRALYVELLAVPERLPVRVRRWLVAIAQQPDVTRSAERKIVHFHDVFVRYWDATRADAQVEKASKNA